MAVSRSRLTVVRHYDRVVAWSVWLLVFGVLLATFVGLPDTHDAEISFQTTSALWHEQSFALSGTPEAELLVREARAAQESGRPGSFPVRIAEDGAAYGWYGIAQAVVALPLFAIGRAVSAIDPELERRHTDDRQLGFERSEYWAHLFVGLRNPLLTAFTAWMIVLCARRMGVRRWGAFLAGITYCLCTFAWPQGRSWLSDVQAAFFLFAGFHLVLRLREERARIGLRRTVLLLIGCSLAAAVATRAVMLPAVLVLEVSALRVMFRRHASHEALPVDRRRGLDPGWRPVAWLFAPQLVALALLWWANTARFGGPLDSGYGAALEGGLFTWPQPRALAGLLVSPGRGLLWLAPGVLLLVLAVPRALRTGQRVWLWTTVALTVAVVVPVLCIQGWHGAWTFGPRYLLPLLPFLWLGVALALERAAEHRPSALLVGTLLVLGLVVNLPAVLVDSGTYHQLAVRVAPLAFDPPEELEGSAREAWLFDRMQFDWRFAAPWAHWRILRHRTAGQGETFPVRELFFLDDDTRVHPATPRHEGRAHFAWVDHTERLGGAPWPPVLAVGLVLALGIVLAVVGLDRAAD